MSKWKSKQQRVITKALARLQRTSGRPFVVVRDDETGKFVQFVGSKTEPLLLDLPSLQILSDKEVKAATKLLGAPRTAKMGPRSDKEYFVFHAGPFERPGAAAGCAVDVMANVFAAEGHALSVQFEKGARK